VLCVYHVGPRDVPPLLCCGGGVGGGGGGGGGGSRVKGALQLLSKRHK